MFPTNDDPDLRAPSARARLVVIAFGTLLSLVAAEFALRIATSNTPYRVLPANVRAEFTPAPGLMPGVTGTSVYSTNSDGIRGRSYPADEGLHILAVGGSTTECLYLDDSEAWPALLESLLGGEAGRPPVWVGSVGVSGHGLAEHIQIARYLLPQLRIDWTVVLAGINDLVPLLRLAEDYRPEKEDPDRVRFLDKAFRSRPLADARWPAAFPTNLAGWHLARRSIAILKRNWRAELTEGDLLVEDRAGLTYARRREALRGVPVLDEIPDLGPALKRFEQNLRVMVDAVHEADSRLLLLTQPSAWNAGLSPEHEALHWIAFLGSKQAPRARYATPALEQAMRRFNETTLRVCRETEAECLDVATAMADADRELYYYDEVHLNERGSRRLAELIARWFRRAPGAKG